MKQLSRLLFLLPLLVLQGCPWYGYKYNEGSLPATPVNFEEINSAYDDYNASSPIAGDAFPLCFSSTRNSAGGNYDIVYKFISIEFSKESGDLRIFEGTDGWAERMKECANLQEALALINSPAEERGPCVLEGGSWGHDEDGQPERSFLLLYDHDSAGHRDIYFTHNVDESNSAYIPPQPALSFNTPFNDAYPCPDTRATAIYFSSDRDGEYDIYRIPNPESRDIFELLASENLPVEKDQVLSSSGNDLCPYIADHAEVNFSNAYKDGVLVFASDREGGYGGFDLYYATPVEGGWSEPVNFGPGINSAHDEFRPIVIPLDEFTHDFMLFSSNRPGGKGGFDLYYVGIEDFQHHVN
jgi:hypothetical protein